MHRLGLPALECEAISTQGHMIDHSLKHDSGAGKLFGRARTIPLREKQLAYADMRMKNGGAVAREVAFHLSRGRSAGDICVRMRLPMSTVEEIIEGLKKPLAS